MRTLFLLFICFGPLWMGCRDKTVHRDDVTPPPVREGHVAQTAVGGNNAPGIHDEDDIDPAARCPALDPPSGNVIHVKPEDGPDLAAIVSATVPGDTVLFADGAYSVKGDVWVTTPNVTLRGKSGDRDAVVLDAAYTGGSILVVAADRVTVADLSLKRAYYHGVHVRPPDGATQHVHGVRLYNIRVLDPRQQGIKGNQEQSWYVDDGEIACSNIVLTDAGRPHVEDCYTGGIDFHKSDGWRVHDNRIEGFWCPAGLAEHGIHFWNQNSNVLIERNQIVNCARGIGLGMADSSSGNDRLHPEIPCPEAYVDDYGGTVRNNMIFVDSPELFASAEGFDTGIALWSACASRVLHNTVWSTQAPFSSIEWRFKGTTAEVKNNLVSHTLIDRGVSTIIQAGNMDGAKAAELADPTTGNLHLAVGAAATDAGVALDPGAADRDIDGGVRDSAPDVGADEYRKP